MSEDELTTRIAALRETLLGNVERHRADVASRVADKGAPARHAAKRRAAIEGDLIRYEMALREKHGLADPYAPRCEPPDELVLDAQAEAE